MTSPRAELPAEVLALLDGTGLREKLGTTVLLATTTDDSWPNVAMLSPGEVLAADARTVHLALHAASGTCRALQNTGVGLLSVVADGAAFRIRVRARHVPQPTVPGTDELFVAAVERIDEDRVPYARVTHGIGYELGDVEGTLERWAAKQSRLRSLG